MIEEIYTYLCDSKTSSKENSSKEKDEIQLALFDGKAII